MLRNRDRDATVHIGCIEPESRYGHNEYYFRVRDVNNDVIEEAYGFSTEEAARERALEFIEQRGLNYTV